MARHPKNIRRAWAPCVACVAWAALVAVDVSAQPRIAVEDRPMAPDRAASAATALAALTAASTAALTATAVPSPLHRVDGMVLLDYQAISLPQHQSLDLMGAHILNKVNDWLYLGIGAYAPLFKGEYGGFMAFDIAMLAQRKIWGNVFANAAFSVGGGGGGKSVQQSIVLSGTGGFARGALGLGYDFGEFAVGANVARIKFKNSAIDSTRLNVYVEVPFSYLAGPYQSFGSKLSVADVREVSAEPSKNVVSVGLVKVMQINPKGSVKANFQLVDFQFSRLLTDHVYWYASLGAGYQGLPLYNQLIGGLGYRVDVAPRLKLHAQLGVGSGGYAPEKIQTGTGLLVYPKMSAEYDLAKNVSMSLVGGYLAAPNGTSKNYTLGASLNYHGSSGGLAAGDDVRFKGYRFSLFQQTDFNLYYRDVKRPAVDMLALQLDSLVSPNLYIPIQASIAYGPYQGFPGYGEVLAGIGVQTEYSPDQRLQYFAELMGGGSAHGLIVKAGVGANYGLSDRLAIRASLGAAKGPSSDGRNFKTNSAGLGMTYRFSLPGW